MADSEEELNETQNFRLTHDEKSSAVKTFVLCGVVSVIITSLLVTLILLVVDVDAAVLTRDDGTVDSELDHGAVAVIVGGFIYLFIAMPTLVAALVTRRRSVARRLLFGVSSIGLALGLFGTVEEFSESAAAGVAVLAMTLAGFGTSVRLHQPFWSTRERIDTTPQDEIRGV